MSTEMTLTEYINDRVYLFFHPIENLKSAFAKSEKAVNRLEIVDKITIKNYFLEKDINKKEHENIALSKNKYPPTSSLVVIDNLMMELLFVSRKIA